MISVTFHDCARCRYAIRVTGRIYLCTSDMCRGAM